MPVVVLEADELEEMLSRAARLAVSELRADLEKNLLPHVMTKAQLSKYLQWSISKIDRLMKIGLPCVGSEGERPRFYREDVDEWLKARR